MNNLNQADLEKFTRKVIKTYCPNAKISVVDHKMFKLALYLNMKGIAASTGIRFFQEIWMVSANPANMTSLVATCRALKDVVLNSIQATIDGEVTVIGATGLKYSDVCTKIRIYEMVDDPFDNEHPYDAIVKPNKNKAIY